MVPERNGLIDEVKALFSQRADFRRNDQIVSVFEGFEQDLRLNLVVWGGVGETLDIRNSGEVRVRRRRFYRNSVPGSGREVFSECFFNHFIGGDQTGIFNTYIQNKSNREALIIIIMNPKPGMHSAATKPKRDMGGRTHKGNRDQNQKEIFIKKLQACMQIYDYTDEKKDVKGKNERLNAINGLQ